MAVDHSAPAPTRPASVAGEPRFHPRLQPRPTRVRGFQDALADSLADNNTGPQAPPAATAKAPSFLTPGVRGVIDRAAAQPRVQTDSLPGVNEVRGKIILPADGNRPAEPAPGPVPAPPPTPAQFTQEEESLLHMAARVSAPARRAASAKKPPRETAPPAESPTQAGQTGLAGQTGDPDALVKTASAMLGKRYSPGGESPRQGFDCSGLSSYVYAKNGLDLPRNSRQQYSQGAPVERGDLRKGDLVFFGRKGVNHVGIYMDDGKFIHAASSGGAVKVGDLDDPLWNKLYAGARRVL